jgi:hypothetical protein
VVLSHTIPHNSPLFGKYRGNSGFVKEKMALPVEILKIFPYEALVCPVRKGLKRDG